MFNRESTDVLKRIFEEAIARQVSSWGPTPYTFSPSVTEQYDL